ncbi:hypothetical protein ACFL5Z_10280 [Planctomycetota bacterium]
MYVVCKKCGHSDILSADKINSPNCPVCGDELTGPDGKSVSTRIEEMNVEYKKRTKEKHEWKAEITRRQAKMQTPEGLSEVLEEYLESSLEFVLVDSSSTWTMGSLRGLLDYRPDGDNWARNSSEHKAADIKLVSHRDYAINAALKLFRKYADDTVSDLPNKTDDPEVDIRAIACWAIRLAKLTLGRPTKKERRNAGERDKQVEKAYVALEGGTLKMERKNIKAQHLANWINKEYGHQYHKMKDDNVRKSTPWKDCHTNK